MYNESGEPVSTCKDCNQKLDPNTEHVCDPIDIKLKDNEERELEQDLIELEKFDVLIEEKETIEEASEVLQNDYTAANNSASPNEVASTLELTALPNNEGTLHQVKKPSAIDKNVLFSLLKNPTGGLKLNPEKDWIYGLIGIGASIIGLFLWALVVLQKIKGQINSAGSVLNEFFGGSSMFGMTLRYVYAKQMLVTSFFALAILLAVLWLIGNWKGERKLAIKEYITYLGSMQGAAGVGFLLGAILSLVSLGLSYIVVAIVALSVILLTYMTSQDLFEIKADNRLLSVLLSSTLFVLLLSVVIKLGS